MAKGLWLLGTFRNTIYQKISLVAPGVRRKILKSLKSKTKTTEASISGISIKPTLKKISAYQFLAILLEGKVLKNPDKIISVTSLPELDISI